MGAISLALAVMLILAIVNHVTTKKAETGSHPWLMQSRQR